MTSSDLNQAIKSTIEALDQFERIIELQELIKLTYEQFDHPNYSLRRTDLLIGIYLKDTGEYMVNVKNSLEEIQSILLTNKS